jgi:hypothetical protein
MSAFRGFCVVLAFLWLMVSSACHCCRSSNCPAEGESGGPLTPHVKGRISLVSLANNGVNVRNTAKIQVDGTFEYSANNSTLKELRAVHVFAAPGTMAADELACDSHLIFTLPSPPRTRWTTPWLEGAWEGATTDYRVLVRYVYTSTVGADVKAYIADQLLKPAVQVPTSVMKPIIPEGSSGTGSTAPVFNCCATFNASDNLALYDVNLSYSFGSSTIVSSIEVYTAPVPGSTIPTLPQDADWSYTVTSPSPRGWCPTGLAGHYDGTSNKYIMLVRINLSGNTSGITSPIDLRGYFDNITSDPGHAVLLE